MAAAMSLAATAQARTIGMIADDSTKGVTVFDADNDTIIGSMSLGAGFHAIDCSINPAGTLGFVTDYDFHLRVVDLTTTPPSLAPGDPVMISNSGEDTATTADGRFILTCDAAGLVSVVDVLSCAEVAALSLGSGCTAVEVCPDGSILTAEYYANRIRRLTIDAAGHLTDTGEMLAVYDPLNLSCAPDGHSGVAVSAYGRNIQSFTIPGLTPIDSRALSGLGVSGIMSPAGDRAFIRSTDLASLSIFGYAGGALSPLLSIAVAPALAFFGADQIALHPDGAKLYVSNRVANSVDVYDAASLMPLSSITDASIAGPAGICVSRATCGNGVVDPGEQCDDGNTIDGDGCNSTCIRRGCGSRCGDGVLDLGEQCDDGNAAAADGCSPFCSIEPGYTCAGIPSLCTTMCGDGFVTPSEQCDDGNLIDGDGCDSNCTPTGCGNGILTAGEACDDGNRADGDACPATCGYGTSGALTRGDGARPARDDRGCQVEWYVVNPSNPPDRFGLPSYRQRCVDNDPDCDADPTPGRCRFQVVVCLNNEDTNLPACVPGGIDSAIVLPPVRARNPIVAALAEKNAEKVSAALTMLRDPLDLPGGFTHAPPLAATQRDLCSAPMAVDQLAASSVAQTLTVVSTVTSSGRSHRHRSRLRLRCSPRPLP